MAASLDLPDVDKGATYRHTLLWADKLKVPINLTNAIARMQVRETVESSIKLLELTSSNGGLLVTPLLGKIELFISDEATTSLVGYGGVYDLEIEFPSGEVTRLIEGSIAFIPEVTR
jgi:hypothetical protein